MRTWSGKILIDGVSADVNAVIQSKAHWYGDGIAPLYGQDDLMRLYYTGRIIRTAIGSITIKSCTKENGLCAFAFLGTDVFLK
jgi:hypothetical protein